MSASSRLSRLFPLACMALVACPSPAPQPAKPDPIPAEPTEPRPDSPSERPLLHTATDDLPREDDPIALPDGATLRLGSMSLSHPSDVTVVSMSRDGSVIASRGMYENAATLWNSKTGGVARRVEGALESLAVSPDGARIATIDNETLAVFDVANGAELVRKKTGHNEPRVIVWSPDGTRLGVGYNERLVLVVDAANGKVLKTLRGKESSMTELAFDASGARIAATGYGGDLLAWDVKSGKNVIKARFAGDSHGVGVGFLSDGTLLGVSNEGELLRFDAAHKAGPPTKLPGTVATAVSAGETLLVSHYGGAMRHIDATGQSVRELTPARPEGQSGSTPGEIAVSADGKTLLAGYSGGKLELLDVGAGGPVSRFAGRGHTGRVSAVAWAPDGAWIASGSEDGSAILWRASNGRMERMLIRPGKVSKVTDVAIAGGTHVMVAYEDGEVATFDAVTGAIGTQIDNEHGARALAVSDDGRRFAIGGGHAFVVSRAAEGEKPRGMQLPDESIQALAFIGPSESASMVVATAHRVRLVQLDDKAVKFGRERRGIRPMTQALAVSTDGAWIYTGGFGGHVEAWKLEGAVASVKTAPDMSAPHNADNPVAAPITCIVALPDGRVASGGYDSAVQLFDASLKPLRRFEGHADNVEDLAVSPDGKHLVSASADRTLLVWRL